MNELTNEKYMSVSEVATALGVTAEAIKKHIRELYPEIPKNGVMTLLTEEQVTNIKTKMRPTTKVVAARTDFEMAKKASEVMEWFRFKLEEAQIKIKELEPKAEFFDAVADSKDAISIGDLAKILNSGIGRNKLFGFLRDNGILQHDNVPYQAYIDRGWFRTIEQKYTVPDGSTKISIKTLVYQKGVDAIRTILEKSP